VAGKSAAGAGATTVSRSAVDPDDHGQQARDLAAEQPTDHDRAEIDRPRRSKLRLDRPT
jgi:hypothetical protein